MEKSIGILSNQYERLTVKDADGKEIATITQYDVTVADDCQVILKPVE